jgi:catechol 2,3-dioxygenase-like lactoylglutathione lyase family enzyme
MGLQVFDHCTIRAADIAASSRFYQDVMGLRAQGLDAFAFPMVLLFLGDRAIVHQLLFDDPDGIEFEVNFPQAEKTS